MPVDGEFWTRDRSSQWRNREQIDRNKQEGISELACDLLQECKLVKATLRKHLTWNSGQFRTILKRHNQRIGHRNPESKYLGQMTEYRSRPVMNNQKHELINRASNRFRRRNPQIRPGTEAMGTTGIRRRSDGN
jgi:hypothetical protein